MKKPQPQLPEIMLSNKGHDFSSWFQEKIGNVLKELSYIAERKEAVAINDDTYDHFAYALSDTIKLFSMIHGCEDVYENDDYKLVLNNGYEGFKELKTKYGMPMFD